MLQKHSALTEAAHSLLTDIYLTERKSLRDIQFYSRIWQFTVGSTELLNLFIGFELQHCRPMTLIADFLFTNCKLNTANSKLKRKLQPYGQIHRFRPKIQTTKFFNSCWAIAYYHYFKKCNQE